MNPQKIKWYLGAASYAMIMEQDRKHWLLKTDRTKQVQDTITGDVFKGRVDNLGSDIIIETEKSYTQDTVVHNGTFSSENVSDVFDLASSVYSFIPELNGLHFLRLKSINLLVDGDYHNFRLVLTNVEECYIPIAPDKDDPDEFVYKWYKTTDRPILQMMDGNGQWTIEQPIAFSEGVTNPVYYYPADEVLQPIDVEVSVGTLTSEVITDQDMIGYPLLWFTCDEANLGPKITFVNNTAPGAQTETKFLSMGHPGNAYMYSCKLFPATGVAEESVPDDNIDDWKLVCLTPAEGEFDGTVGDFTKRIKSVLMKRITDESDDQVYIRFINDKGNNVITMNPDVGWTYDENTNSYSIPMETFITNLYGTEEVLIPAFDVRLDETISFENTTTDTGFAGMSMGSSKNNLEQQPRYPHDLQNLEGLPEWIRNPDENSTPQHMAIYAVHNTPFYKPSDQSTRQIAGLILDPGVERTYEDNFHPGEYAIGAISVVSGGSGYNHMFDERIVVRGYYYNTQFYEDDQHTTPITGEIGKMYIDIPSDGIYMYDADSSTFSDVVTSGAQQINGKNRLWITFNDGSRSRTLVEVKSVDENGAVTELNPLYVDSADDHVKQMVYGYYDLDKNKFFTDYTETEEIPPDESIVYYATNEGRVYRYSIESGNTYTLISGYLAGSAYEEAYDPYVLTGTHLSTTWDCDSPSYTQEELVAARNAQLAGSGTGLMPDGNPWWYHTYTTGTGLVVSIEEAAIEEITPPFTSDDVPTDQIGRVYVISNDSPTYQNNKTAANPKPERTIARICDIPQSVMQLLNISGLAPTMVVDKKYVRSEATFTANDQDYLYNSAKSRWVRPTALNAAGLPIYSGEPDTQSNAFIFDSMELLQSVDLVNHNDFRETTNLNQGVDPNDVSIAAINNGGSGYHVGSVGTIVVGGYSFTYEVTAVSLTGAVTSAMIASNDASDTRINLANFDLVSEETATGLTVPYGTSPKEDTSGTGLKVTLQIANFDSVLPHKGDIFTDLFAFVSDFDGIWLVTRKNDSTGWRKNTQLAMSYASETKTIDGEPSLRDSYLNSILPSARELMVNPMAPYSADIKMKALVTASSINVIDSKCTPVHVPSTAATSDSDMYDSLTVIDINKLYCRGYRTLHATSRNVAAVMQAIRADNGDRFDSYIFWNWLQPENPANFDFVYGVVHRSLDNLQTTESASVLPGNNLVTKNFVHTNTQTTIMWNVPHVGPMVWMFDPNSTVHEKYYVNAHTRELYVTREPLSWADVEVTDDAGTTTLKLAEGSGQTIHATYNLYTNNPAIASAVTTNDIYQQPDYVKVADVNSSLLNRGPRGAWRLVFPSILTTGTFKLKSDQPDDGREFTPVRMTVLRGSNISNTSDVLNEDGDPVNYKTLLIDENVATGRVDLRVYDQESHRWMNI